MTSTATRTVLCPAWCVEDHTYNPDVHTSEGRRVDGVHGTPLLVRAVYDSTLDVHNVHVGETELTQDTGADLIYAIREALNLPLGAVTR